MVSFDPADGLYDQARLVRTEQLFSGTKDLRDHPWFRGGVGARIPNADGARLTSSAAHACRCPSRTPDVVCGARLIPSEFLAPCDPVRVSA